MHRPIMLIGSLLLAAAPAARPDPLLVRLQEKLDGLTGLTGRFVQSLEGAAGASRTEEGRLAFRKPGLMRWDYERPEEKLALVDGRHTWLYVPGERQAHRGSLRDLEREGAAAMLLAGRVSLLKDFASRRLDATEAGPTGVAGGAAFELLPRKRSEDLAKILLVLEPESIRIRRVVVVGSAGERMVFDLFDLQENPDLPDALFRFDPPAGVEILDED